MNGHMERLARGLAVAFGQLYGEELDAPPTPAELDDARWAVARVYGLLVTGEVAQ